MKLNNFSKTFRYTPEFGGNANSDAPAVAIMRPMDMHRMFLVTEVYQRAGLAMQGAIETSSIPVAQMKEIIETIRADVAPFVKLEGLTDADGLEITMEDVTSYAPLYPLAMELFTTLLVKSAPNEDDAKNSDGPPASA